MEYAPLCRRMLLLYPDTFGRYISITPLIDDNYEFQYLGALRNYYEDIQNNKLVKAVLETDEYLTYDTISNVQHHFELYLMFNQEFLDFSDKVKSQRRIQNKRLITQGTKELTYSVEGYFYWVTLTPKVAPENKLRKFVDNLKKLSNIKFFGCFETSKSEHFHLHIIIKLEKKIDITKNPWRQYKEYFKPILLKNYNEILVKARYCITEEKDGKKEEIFGDFDYFNNLCKSQTGQILKKGFIMPKLKEIPHLINWD